MWMYFLRKLHPMALQNTLFGFANYTGLVAALLFLMLLLISNDISLRALGIKKWKSAQRWTYVAFAMTIGHGVAYQWIEKRHVLWAILFATFTMMVVVVQLAGFWRKKSTLPQVKQSRN
jgi:methionine sulfoxide reductase heme-binding subunit